MEATRIQSLPAEILEMILDYLEEDPPSYFGSCVQPTLNLISSKHKHPPLKSFSRVSRAFRRFTIPRLFRHTLHLVTIEARNQELKNEEQSFPEWPRKFWEFVALLETLELEHVVRSFTLAIKEHPELDEDTEHDEWRFSRSISEPVALPPEAVEYQRRWIHLFSHATPFLSRVTIIAPPPLFEALSGISLESLLAVVHVPYQILGLWIHPFLKHRCIPQPEQSSFDQLPLLTARPWTHLLINEGSFRRKAHPADVDSLMEHDFISSRLCNLQLFHNIFPELRSVSYTGILAPAEHLRRVVLLLGALPKLVEFYFSLQSTSPLLSDPHPSRHISPGLAVILWQDGYSVLANLSSQAEEIAQILGLEKCLEHVKHVKCLDEEELRLIE